MRNSVKDLRIGRLEVTTTAGETVQAYIPPQLPPIPALDLSGLYPKIDKAMQALGRLDGLTTLLPDTHLFLYFYIRKEAVLSSQIEGTQSSLSDLLLFEKAEQPSVPLDDVKEVSSYVRAMEHGLQKLRDGFPLSLRFLKEIHAILLQDGRGAEKDPGEFRRSQNWIDGARPGNATYVPPPPEMVMECMGALENFLHDEKHLPILVKAALVHVQFESIHPFLDGNGRLGRLLITFLLCVEGVMREPLLYLSLYLKMHRNAYYDLLQKVRFEGDWESWLDFFLDGVALTADQAADAANRILKLFQKDREKIGTLGRAAGSVLRVHDYLQQTPYLTVTMAAQTLNLSRPTISKAVSHFQRLGIVQEITGRQRDRLFRYTAYFNILQEGTEPLA